MEKKLGWVPEITKQDVSFFLQIPLENCVFLISYLYYKIETIFFLVWEELIFQSLLML